MTYTVKTPEGRRELIRNLDCPRESDLRRHLREAIELLDQTERLRQAVRLEMSIFEDEPLSAITDKHVENWIEDLERAARR